MQFIFFLLSLFAIGCVLYGISAGVQSIQRGFSWMGKAGSDVDKQIAMPAPSTTATAAVEPTLAVQIASSSGCDQWAFPLRHSIGELRELFALYQQGALTREEFEGMKRQLLAGIRATAPQNH